MEPDKLEFAFQPYQRDFAIFLEPSRRRLWFPIAVLELWPNMKQLCLSVRSVSLQIFFFFLQEEKKACLTEIVILNDQS